MLKFAILVRVGREVSRLSRKQATMSTTVCELGDATITIFDLAILESPTAWLNDNIITFYIEWLNKLQGKGMTTRKDVILIHPGSAFMLRLLPPAEIMMNVGKKSNPFVDARQKDVSLIAIPVNSADNPSSGGGSHWSLVVFDKVTLVAKHFDSYSGFNREVAKKTASCLAKVLSLDRYMFVEPDTAQQQNTYDCGVFTLINLRNLFLTDDEFSSKDGTKKFRKHLVELIAKERV